jgi:hypothetical protein
MKRPLLSGGRTFAETNAARQTPPPCQRRNESRTLAADFIIIALAALGFIKFLGWLAH